MVRLRPRGIARQAERALPELEHAEGAGYPRWLAATRERSALWTRAIGWEPP